MAAQGSKGAKGGGKKGRWQDGRYRNRGKEEIAADRRVRWRQEKERARVDRDARSWSLEDHEVVIPTGDDALDVHAVPAADKLGEVLAAMVKARGWEERLLGADLETRWPEIVGEQLAARSTPGRLAGGILRVEVESPQWATQLQYMTSDIIGRVAAVTGSVVREVQFVVTR